MSANNARRTAHRALLALFRRCRHARIGVDVGQHIHDDELRLALDSCSGLNRSPGRRRHGDESLSAVLVGEHQIASALNEVARSAALTDPDVAATFQRLERLRWDGYRSLLEMVATKGRLHDGMDVDSATDALVTLVCPRTYLSLTVDRGWSAERALAWMADIVPAAILLPNL